MGQHLKATPDPSSMSMRAGLIDEMHFVIAPILLGGGERLFDDLGDGPPGYRCVEFVSSPAVAHVRLARTEA